MDEQTKRIQMKISIEKSCRIWGYICLPIYVVFQAFCGWAWVDWGMGTEQDDLLMLLIPLLVLAVAILCFVISDVFNRSLKKENAKKVVEVQGDIEKEMKQRSEGLKNLFKAIKPEVVYFILFVVIAAIIHIMVDMLFVSMLISAVATGAIALGVWLISSAKNKTHRFWRIVGGVLLIAAAIGGVVLFALINAEVAFRCVECGKISGNYSNGYCHSCYEDVKDQVVNDYYESFY